MAQSSFENISIADLVKKVNAARRYIARYADTSKPKQLKKLKYYRDFLEKIDAKTVIERRDTERSRSVEMTSKYVMLSEVEASNNLQPNSLKPKSLKQCPI